MTLMQQGGDGLYADLWREGEICRLVIDGSWLTGRPAGRPTDRFHAAGKLSMMV